jgi:streptogramin lyase
MKFYWFNDTKKRYVLYGPTFNDYLGGVEPQSGQTFEVELGDGEMPFIKVWDDGAVLVSGIKTELTIEDKHG